MWSCGELSLDDITRILSTRRFSHFTPFQSRIMRAHASQKILREVDVGIDVEKSKHADDMQGFSSISGKVDEHHWEGEACGSEEHKQPIDFFPKTKKIKNKAKSMQLWRCARSENFCQHVGKAFTLPMA